MTDSTLHYVDLWKKQSELFWRTVYSVPFIGIAIFAGWFGLEMKQQFHLSQFLLVAGILIMGVQMAILYRMAQYLNAFHEAARDLMPEVPKSFCGLSGYRIGVAIPSILVVLFIIMFFLNPSPTAGDKSQKPAESSEVQKLETKDKSKSDAPAIKAEQDGADQPATAPKSKQEGKEKPKSESEARSQ